MSLAMTDHYFDQATLEQIGATVRDGKSIDLDPQSRKNPLEVLRNCGPALGILGEQSVDGSASKDTPLRPTIEKRPWWKFWGA
jgi:hypothetical protein